MTMPVGVTARLPRATRCFITRLIIPGDAATTIRDFALTQARADDADAGLALRELDQEPDDAALRHRPEPAHAL
jgi:hypothetical protein